MSRKPLVELFDAKNTDFLFSGTEGIAATSTSVAGSGDACDDGISTKLWKEVHRLARAQAAVGERPVELCAQSRLGAGAQC